jgi:DNA-binding NarL/FixJ family response regulator
VDRDPPGGIERKVIEGVRIFLVDDHTIVRSSLGMMMESYGARVVGEAEDGQSAIDLALALRPDVILMDLTLPGMDGIEATRRICAAWPEARVLALTMHTEEEFLIPFLEAGGAGFVSKSAADRDVLQAIRSILDGKPFLGERGILALVSQHSASPEKARPGPEVLSERERTVLELTVRGYTSREIGQQLSLSPHTIDTYRARIMEKLDLEHRHELVDFAIRHHFLG